MEALAVTRWLMPGLEKNLPVEAELIQQAKSDPEAMAELFRNHYAPIGRYIQHRVGSSSTAEDLTSEVFLTMVRYLPRFRVNGTPFRAWLYRLATNQVNRWARHQRRFAWKQLQDYPSSETQGLDEESAARIRAALLTLPVHYQSALALHYLEELPVESVAQVLGCAVGTVKSRLARGRDLLRPLLSEQDDCHDATS
jgi:RNA polymerase sigma-70 factor, ECF subfamily